MKDLRNTTSIHMGLKALTTWYGLLGFMVATIALINLAVGLFTIGPSAILQVLLETYRAIAHKLIGWLTVWLPFTLPPYAKDVVILWAVIGGAIARTKDSFMYLRHGSLKLALFELFGRRNPNNLEQDTSTRIVRVYHDSPRWLKLTLDGILWPLSIINILNIPYASIGAAKNHTWYRQHQNKDNEQFESVRKQEGYIDILDLRIVLLVQIAALIAAVIAVVALNTSMN